MRAHLVRASRPTAHPTRATPHFSFRPYRVAASVVPIPNRRCADANCALMSAFLADRTSAARDDVAKRPRKHASQRRTRHRGARRSIAVAAAARVTAPAAAVPIPTPARPGRRATIRHPSRRPNRHRGRCGHQCCCYRCHGRPSQPLPPSCRPGCLARTVADRRDSQVGGFRARSGAEKARASRLGAVLLQ